MGCIIKVRTADCFEDRMMMCHGVYWGMSGGSNTRPKISFSKTGRRCSTSLETHEIDRNGTAYFDNRKYVVKGIGSGHGWAEIDVSINDDFQFDEGGAGGGSWDVSEDEAAGEIKEFDIYKNVGNVGEKIGYSVSVANMGDAGKLHVAIGIGYINDKSLAVFSGKPVRNDVTISPGYKTRYTGSLTVQQSDFAAQDGTGWGYPRRELKVFFMVYHYEGSDKVRDDYKMPNFTIRRPYVTPPTIPKEHVPPKGIIHNRSADLLEVHAGLSVNYRCLIKNTGDTGKITLRVGFGYIDKDNMIMFTGDNHYKTIDIAGGREGVIEGFLTSSIEDFYAQEGTGWAYTPKQIRIFFITEDDNKNLTIKITEPRDYKDPTDPTNWGDPDDEDPEPESKTPWELLLDVIGRVKFKLNW